MARQHTDRGRIAEDDVPSHTPALLGLTPQPHLTALAAVAAAAAHFGEVMACILHTWDLGTPPQQRAAAESPASHGLHTDSEDTAPARGHEEHGMLVEYFCPAFLPASAGDGGRARVTAVARTFRGKGAGAAAGAGPQPGRPP